MSRVLDVRPTVETVPGIALRHFAGSDDVELWLELRRRAFARERFGVRDWTAADFAREFLHKPWWAPDRMWFAVAADPARGDMAPMGTIALATRESATQARSAIHWLAVLPSHRRRGIGRLLLSAAEAACWDVGERQVWLETHAAWKAAAQLYESLGYRASA